MESCLTSSATTRWMIQTSITCKFGIALHLASVANQEFAFFMLRGGLGHK